MQSSEDMKHPKCLWPCGLYTPGIVIQPQKGMESYRFLATDEPGEHYVKLHNWNMNDNCPHLKYVKDKR